MGINGLTKLISEKAPGAMKEDALKNYFGRRIAIDASMSIYQFIIAMKGALGGEGELTNQEGEVTSHLQGMWNRTLKMLSYGLKPVYVFDGAPPKLKCEVLASRKARQAEAVADLEAAEEEGQKEEALRLNKRTVRVSKEQSEECKKLLTLMGLPVVQAPTEAEATCAALVKSGRCWAVGTEDMDALTFGAPRLLRHLDASEAKKLPILEINLQRVLDGLELTMDQFIDTCILLGCDYCAKITGIGPTKAYEGIKKHKTIEGFMEALDGAKYKVPELFPIEDVRELFRNPEVATADEASLAIREPDTEGLIKFLCDEKLFSRERVEKGIKKLHEARQQKTQGRLDTFFTVLPSTGSSSSASALGKRKAQDEPKGGPGKKPAAGKKAVVGFKK